MCKTWNLGFPPVFHTCRHVVLAPCPNEQDCCGLRVVFDKVAVNSGSRKLECPSTAGGEKPKCPKDSVGDLSYVMDMDTDTVHVGDVL